ncbi:unnamed protein product [Amoebophrya sp. A25]|nr:unnamed protein product [Amoebophrya sp. A25]|eukprot:GSA25T00005889001.1
MADDVRKNMKGKNLGAPELASSGRSDDYYRDRALAYHETTQRTQDELTDVACWHFLVECTAGTDTDRDPSGQAAVGNARSDGSPDVACPIVVDIGCGSGLSASRFKARMKETRSNESRVLEDESKDGYKNEKIMIPRSSTAGKNSSSSSSKARNVSTSIVRPPPVLPFVIGLDRSREMLELDLPVPMSSSCSRQTSVGPRSQSRYEEKILCDCFGAKLPLRRGVSDSVLSISALQWLFVDDGEKQEDEGQRDTMGKQEFPTAKRRRVEEEDQVQHQVKRHDLSDQQNNEDLRVQIFFDELRRITTSHNPPWDSTEKTIRSPPEELLRLPAAVCQFYPTGGNPQCLLPLKRHSRGRIWCHYPHMQSKKKFYLVIPRKAPRAQAGQRASCSKEEMKERDGQLKKLDADCQLYLENYSGGSSSSPGGPKDASTWCALCWPHCAAESGLLALEAEVGTQLEQKSNEDEEKDKSDSAFSRLGLKLLERSRKEHLLVFSRFARNMARLVQLETSTTGVGTIQDDRKHSSSTRPAMKIQREAIFKELGPPGVAVGWAIYLDLLRRHRHRQLHSISNVSGGSTPSSSGERENLEKMEMEKNRAEVENDLRRRLAADGNVEGVEQEHLTHISTTMKNLPSARELTSYLTDSEKLRLLLYAPCPWSELAVTPTTYFPTPTLREYLLRSGFLRTQEF